MSYRCTNPDCTRRPDQPVQFFTTVVLDEHCSTFNWNGMIPNGDIHCRYCDTPDPELVPREPTVHEVLAQRIPTAAQLQARHEQAERTQAYAVTPPTGECFDCGAPAPIGLYQCNPCHLQASDEESA